MNNIGNIGDNYNFVLKTTDREVELKNTFLTAYDVKEKAIAYLKPSVLKHRGLFYFATRHHIINITK